jgi:hypothetical protein
MGFTPEEETYRRQMVEFFGRSSESYILSLTVSRATFKTEPTDRMRATVELGLMDADPLYVLGNGRGRLRQQTAYPKRLTRATAQLVLGEQPGLSDVNTYMRDIRNDEGLPLYIEGQVLDYDPNDLDWDELRSMGRHSLAVSGAHVEPFIGDLRAHGPDSDYLEHLGELSLLALAHSRLIPFDD